ncbi:tetratricopeptide repeat-containing sulfotransferase family protein [Rhodanobacter lindaniclasticus]|uniref:Sulfotransferase family protein n=1 Tax=Rhodanobacter lindaniclasticus TaxID=75310 RepID=A0A4S3KE82_9GAMM|nr:sulfotransferase [Rhodanobacter lindaniclasticus]THD06234.1 sulfotransferase family protein [Rhodanobacter lindaniclasticus]
MAAANPTAEETRLRESAGQAIASQRWQAAEEALAALVRRVPDDLHAQVELAQVMLRRGRLREAAACMLQLARHLPRDAGLILKVIRCLLGAGETVAARACLDLLAQAPRPPAELLAAQAHLRFQIGEIAPARVLLEQALAAGVDTPGELQLHAMLLQFSGELERARAVLQRCLTRWPQFGDAAVAWVNLGRQTPTDNRLDALREQLHRLPRDERRPDVTFVRAQFEYARFKTLHDLGRHEEAWPALASCNALMRELNPYDPRREVATTDALTRMTPAPAATRDVAAGPTPIFIVGMPRSGTTLLDRMLSAHSQVASAGEITDFRRQLHWLTDVPAAAPYGLQEIARRAGELDHAELGARYLAQTRWRAQGRAYYIDKLPANIQLVGFIRRALPQAPILHMVRDPLDVCFSNFRTFFGNISPHSYELRAQAHYYAQYARLARHWHACLPGAMLDVHYETLVHAPEAELARVLAHCGLAPEAACLHPERHPGPVATPSSAQVREPIHTRGFGEWQPYARQLEPLREALEAGVPAP